MDLVLKLKAFETWFGNQFIVFKLKSIFSLLQKLNFALLNCNNDSLSLRFKKQLGFFRKKTIVLKWIRCTNILCNGRNLIVSQS